MTEDVRGAFAEIRRRIAVAAAAAGRDPAAIRLVAVSKEQPDNRVEAALAAGHRVFGENRVQEATARWAARRATWPDLRLHLVGPLQTNKVRDALALFDVIETLDRPRLVEALAAAFAAGVRRPALYVQVNTGEEPQKAGVVPAELPALLDLAAGRGLAIAGLMCIPPVDEHAAPHFALLDELARRHGLAERSMGMSDDFETAIHQGATAIRVGAALFGSRPPRG